MMVGSSSTIRTLILVIALGLMDAQYAEYSARKEIAQRISNSRKLDFHIKAEYSCAGYRPHPPTFMSNVFARLHADNHVAGH